MRKLILLAFGGVFFLSCQSTDYTLNVSADVQDEQQLYLIMLDDNNQPKTIDTLLIKEGISSYSGTIELPEMHYLLLEGNRDVVPFVLEPGDIAVEIYKDSIRSSVVRGTKSNKEFKLYINETTPIVDDLFSIQNEMRNAIISRDSLAYVDLQDQLEDMQEKFNDLQIEYVKSNPESYISTLILEQLLGNKIIEKEEASEIYSSFSKTLKKTKSGVKIGEIVAPEPQEEKTEEESEEGVSVGDIAPDFIAPDINGNTQALYTSLGKYTLIDFWASWCGPCRVDSPNLVKIHETYKDKGLAVIGVSIDKDKESWQKAIASDKLAWTHVSYLKRWDDPIAKQYGVKSIPTLFLLDNEGKVIFRGNHAEDILPTLEKLL